MSTSNRRQAFATPESNPATKFISWKSNDKCFSYFDKAIAESLKGASDEEIKEKANVKIQLPFRFLVLEELASVKGWSDALTGNIVSNEVKFISKEIMTAKCYHKNAKGERATTEIAKGLYKDIKDRVNTAGAKYHKSVYVMLEDGSLANIQLKGACVGKWGEFSQKARNRFPDEFVICEKVIDGKKGAVKFTTPEFKFERSLNEQEASMADDAFEILESYLKTYLTKGEPTTVEEIEVEDPEQIEIDEDKDDLDF